MARPTGWDVLGLDGDPTPGVVESVEALAKQFHDFADDAERAWRNLNGFGADTTALEWVGQTADAFKANFGPLPGRMQKLYVSYREAGDALATYAPKLLAAQNKADAALRQAQDAHADVQRATTTATTAAADLKTAQQNQAAVPNPQAVTDAQTTHDTAQKNLATAKAHLASLATVADGAYNDRIAAAKDCAKALHQAQSDGIHNKHWWEHVGAVLSEWGGKIAEIAGDLAPILDVIALATSWIPGVDVVTAALAEADNLIALVATAVAIVGDGMQGHWGDALLGAGMLALTFVGGRALGKLGREAEEGESALGNATRDADGNGPAFCKDDPIDVVSGQMLTSKTDLALPGILPVILRRAYSSGYQNGRLFGPGWSSTLDQRLSVNAAGIHLTTDDAQTLHFPLPESWETVEALRGPRTALVWDRETDEIRVTDPETGRVSHFPAVHHQEDAGQIRDLMAVSDRNGNRISILRTDDGTPLAVEHPAYRVAVDSVASAAGPRVTGLRLLDGSADGITVARFEYDERGRLVAVSEGAGGAGGAGGAEGAERVGAPFRYEYDAADRIVAWFDQAGYRYGYEYDEAGRVVRTLGAGGYLSGAFAYDAAARITRHRSSLGHVTTYGYDELGHITRVADASGAVSHYAWDRHGDLLAYTDEVGSRTVYTVDDRGDTVRTVRPDGVATTVTYNDLHQPTRVDAPDGQVWRYEYDERGNLTGSIDPIGAVTRYSYTAEGAVTTAVDALGNTVRYRTDAAGLPTHTTDETGSVWTFGYDAFGRPATAADPLGATTVSAWDVQGRPLSRTLPDGAVERWVWDARGNLVARTDANGRTTRHEYGPFQSETARIEADGTRYTFAYDTELRLIAVTNPAGARWSYAYDRLGRLVGEQDFDGRRLGYAHDPAGRLVRRVNGAGQVVELVRDAIGRVVRQQADDGQVVAVEYDLAGAMVAARSQTGELRFTRDPRGHVVGESVNGRMLSSSVDAVGRRVSRTTPSGRVSTWHYDAAGRPSALAGAGWDLRFTHDAAGRETRRRIGPGAEFLSEWDSRGRLVARWLVGTAAADGPGGGASATDGNVLHGRRWSYQADGTLAAVADSALGRQRIEVDARNRVTAVQAATWRETFAYDSMGNLAFADDTRVPEGDTAGPREYAGTRLRQAGRTSYEYDGQGRLVRRVRRTLSGARRVWTYGYDAFDRLVEATLPDGERWRYGYDPLGRRIRKQRLDVDGVPAEEVVFVWDGAVLAEEVRTVRGGLGPVTTTWDYEPNSWTPVAQERRVYAAEAPQEVVDARFHAIVTDLVGAPTELVTVDGRVAWRADRTLWGASLSGSGFGSGFGTGGTDWCPLGFPGQYRDEETGLDYNYLRYYDPENGRYTTPDPLGLTPSPNHYAYVDNPYTWIDPFGLAKGKGGGGGNSGPPKWATDELAKIKAGNGTPRTVSVTDPTQKVWTGTIGNPPPPDAYKRKWGEQDAVPPNADGTGGRPAFPGSPEWEVPAKPGNDYRIVGPNQYGEYGYTDNHYGKITPFPKCTP